MKLTSKILAVALIVTTFLSISTQALADGDKVRGDEGVGGVVQNQESGLPYAPRP